MKLHFITQDFPPVIGGIQTYSAELAKRLHEKNVDLTLLAPSQKGSELFDDSVNYSIERYRCSSSYLGLKLLFKYPDRLISEKIDAVFHAQWQTLLPSIKAKKRGANLKIFCAAHARELFLNPFSISKQRELPKWFVKKRKELFQQVDHFFPVSNFTKQLLVEAGVNPHKITVMSNGTNPKQFYPDPTSGVELKKQLGLEGKKVIYSICRLVPTKGMDTIIEAISIIARKSPEVHYVIAGSGPDAERLDQMVKKLGLEEHVSLVGRVPDDKVNAYYNMVDVFVMVSRQEHPNVEGFGIVFLEANACAKPVIGALTGGIPDAIEDGQTGFIIPPNDPIELSKKIDYLFNHEELMIKMGQQGRDRVLESFNWDVVAEKLYHSIEKLTKDSGSIS